MSARPPNPQTAGAGRVRCAAAAAALVVTGLAMANAVASATAGFGSPHRVDRVPEAVAVTASVGADGTGRVAFVRGSKNALLVASSRPPRTAFSDPVAVGALGAGARFPVVRLDAEGRAMVVFAGGGRSVAAALAGQSGRLGASMTLSGGPSALPQMDAGAHGDAAAVWFEGTGRLRSLRVALRPAGATAFSPAATLATEIPVADTDSGPRVAVNADGHLVIPTSAGEPSTPPPARSPPVSRPGSTSGRSALTSAPGPSLRAARARSLSGTPARGHGRTT